MTYNKIYVSFGALRKITGPFISYQYDVQQILVINGLNLPEYYEVDFCNEGDTYTETIVGTVDGGVAIPNKFLRTGKKVKAYLVLVGDGDVQTRYEITLPVNVRPQRQDIDPTDDQQLQIDSLIAALNSGVASAEAAAKRAEDASVHTPQIVDGYWYLWDADTEQYVTSGVKAEGIDGDDGVGISSVRLNADYTLTLVFTDESEYTTPVSIRGPKGDPFTYEDFTEAQKEELVQGPILDAQTAAVEAVNAAGTTQTGNVNQAGTAKVNEINQAGTTQTGAVNQAGAAQVTAVNQAGAAQVQAVEDKGEEVLYSIPQDYTDLVDDVADLTRHLSDLEDTVSTTQIINSASGAIASFDDGADGQPIRKLVAQIEPVQDLHGYDSPWPAGGGKNIVDFGTITPAITNYRFQFPTPIPAGSYVLSFDVADLSWSSSTDTFIAWIGYDSGQYNMFFSDIKRVSDNALLKNLAQPVTGRFYVAVTTNADGKHCNIAFRSDSYKLFTSGTMSNIMLEAGTAPTDFAPYSNLCPISGHTGLTVARTGKNLLRLVESEMTNVGWNRQFPFSIKAGIYTLSCQNKFIVGSCDGCQINLQDDNNNNIATITTGYNFGNVEFSKTSVITEEMANAITKILFQPRVGGCTFANIMDAEIMFELGSTATPYEPYTGEEISVNWEDEAGTVYGGTLTINPDRTGTLVVDRELRNAKTLIWSYDTISDVKYFDCVYAPSKETGKRQILCSHFKPVVSQYLDSPQDVTITNAWARYYNINVRYDTLTSLEEWNTFINNNDVMIGWYLATPITYTMTESEISGILTTLYGTNNIWSSTGDTEVEYPCDTKLYIDGKITQAIAAALNA